MKLITTIEQCVYWCIRVIYKSSFTADKW